MGKSRFSEPARERGDRLSEGRGNLRIELGLDDDAHQVGNGARTRLIHDRSAVRFHCLDGNAEIVGDLLIEASVHDALEHLLFARRELLDQRAVLRERLAALEELLGGLHGALDELLELRLLEGLLDEVHGALLEGLNRLRHVAVTGDEDERSINAAPEQMVLHVGTRHAGHSQVAKNDGGNIFIELGNEGLSAFIVLNAVVRGLEKPFDRFTNICVVIDYVDEPVLVFSGKLVGVVVAG